MIHESLSSNGWITPQIDYLLWLQNLRVCTHGVLDNCFLNITFMGEVLVPTLTISIIYWCFSSKAGMYLFTLNSMGLLIAHFFKMIACIYRPWVLSDKVKPVEAAIKMAGGYSFPSGHSTMASTTWGGMAYLLRSKKILCSLLILLVLLIAFSRNYVGVHTPQDVIIGILIGFVFVFFTSFLLKWCEKDKNRYLYAMAAFSVIALLIFSYIVNKHYPQDYVNGKILVDPKHAKYITVLYIGWVMGMFNGVFLCRRFFPFEAKEGSVVNKVIRAFTGSAIFLTTFYFIKDDLFNDSWSYPVAFLVLFSIGIFMTAIYPLIFSSINKMLK